MTMISDADRSRRIDRTSVPDYTATPVVSVAELKTWLRLPDIADEDATLQALLLAATDLAEQYTWLSLLPTGITLWLDHFPGQAKRNQRARDGIAPQWQGDAAIVLASGPVDPADVSEVAVYDDDGTQTVLTAGDDYRVDSTSQRNQARVYPGSGTTWSITSPMRDYSAVSVSYTAGYATADLVPEQIKTGILMAAAAMYAHRGDCGPGASAQASGAINLWSKYRLSAL